MFSSLFTPSDTIYEETPPIHFGTRTVMRNDSTGQFEGGECLEGASSLSAARFEGTGLLQHGSYVIGCKSKTREKQPYFRSEHQEENSIPCLGY